MRARENLRTDDERVAEIEEHIEFLSTQMRDTDDKSEVAKLANSITQMHHQLTTIEHLKLQREKAKPDGDEPLDKLEPAELLSRIDATQKRLDEMRKKLKPKAVSG